MSVGGSTYRRRWETRKTRPPTRRPFHPTTLIARRTFGYPPCWPPTTKQCTQSPSPRSAPRPALAGWSPASVNGKEGRREGGQRTDGRTHVHGLRAHGTGERRARPGRAGPRCVAAADAVGRVCRRTFARGRVQGSDSAAFIRPRSTVRPPTHPTYLHGLDFDLIVSPASLSAFRVVIAVRPRHHPQQHRSDLSSHAEHGDSWCAAVLTR